MYAIIGIIVVLGSVVGGYVMEGGNIHVLIQPAEIVIICGAAIGSLFIASTPNIIKLIFENIGTIFSSGNMSKSMYIELLSLLNMLFTKIRKEGLISIENDIENPEKSVIFKKHTSVISNRHALDFICDTLKVIITTNVPPHELDTLLDIDIDSHYEEAMIPSSSISTIADALPGLGIVAAVLGVVITMEKINEPPAVLGHSIGAALTGTFLGVLACYGFVGPIGTNLKHKANESQICFHVIKVALVSFVGGAAPKIAVEFGRRAIPGKERPTFVELEKATKK
jgi:chemotaxis protein MotA